MSMGLAIKADLRSIPICDHLRGGVPTAKLHCIYYNSIWIVIKMLPYYQHVTYNTHTKLATLQQSYRKHT